MKEIPTAYSDLVASATKAFAFLATIKHDGKPQVTPVWFSWEDGFLLINSAKGRVKDQNMRRNPAVAAVLMDPANPYRYIQIQGIVEEISEKNADEHINQLSLKYDGKPWPKVPGQVRVIYRIRPENIQVNG